MYAFNCLSYFLKLLALPGFSPASPWHFPCRCCFDKMHGTKIMALPSFSPAHNSRKYQQLEIIGIMFPYFRTSFAEVVAPALLLGLAQRPFSCGQRERQAAALRDVSTTAASPTGRAPRLIVPWEKPTLAQASCLFWGLRGARCADGMEQRLLLGPQRPVCLLPGLSWGSLGRPKALPSRFW